LVDSETEVFIEYNIDDQYEGSLLPIIADVIAVTMRENYFSLIGKE